MEAQLRKLGPHPKKKVLKINKDSPNIWVCGRGSNCNISTKSKYASRRHFSITFKNGEYFISDLNSINGTYLNNEKITGEKMLKFGNIISVGVPADMVDSPDCVAYEFEPSEAPLDPETSSNSKETAQTNSEDEIHLISAIKNESKSANPCINDVQEQLPISDKLKLSAIEDVIANCLKSKTGVKIHLPSKEGAGGYKIHLFVERSEDGETMTVNENGSNKVADDCSNDDVNNSKSSDVVVIEEPNNRLGSPEGPTPAKVAKVENSNEEPMTVTLNESEDMDEDDLEVYGAATQIDESQVEVKDEEISDSMNYSQTEELIEIDDSDDADWVSSSKPEEIKFEADEDDDVIFLQTIIKPPKESAVPADFEIGDDFTETDRKWLGKLVRVKEDKEMSENLSSSLEDNVDNAADETVQHEREAELPPKDTFVPVRNAVVKPTETLHDLRAETLPPAEKPPEKKKGGKKVRFNLVPKIKLIDREVTNHHRIFERGKQQYSRVIYNLCNWNAHWLEECAKIPSDVHPPGLSDQPCKKVKNSYLNHAQYMSTFVPNMILQVWEKVKEKCVNSYNFFKQTVAFDSYTNYPNEKLTLCRCTGLVQSVPGHKNLLREGHIVVLRVHQAPQFSNRGPEKYSEKVGYLIFGFVESKIYERFTDQKIHPKLAERAASLVGEFHIVRLEIFVKLRPNLKIDKEKLISITVIHQISPALRRFRGICYLPFSPLCQSVLKLPTFQLPEPSSSSVVFKGPLSYNQKEIVLRLSQACMSMNSFLYSIHGAAGTGKSHVIIALIWQLLFNPIWKGSRPKIILCSQDGAPLDDMVFRLKNSISDQNASFGLVRASYSNPIKPEIKDLCLFAKSRKLANQFLNCEAEVLKKADVICTSCTSPMMSNMITVFGNRKNSFPDKKVVCIIDDAISTRETDCVVPLLFGVTHLILVGDMHQTQPSYSSQTMWSLRVDIPLFLRIYEYFKTFPEEERPIFNLRSQYRIKRNLFEFLNRHVYTIPFIVSETDEGVNLKSHLLFVDQIEVKDKLQKEKRENSLTRRLVWELKKIQGSLRYAVITCSEEQSQNLQKKMTKSDFPQVEVNKVQAFHGREFDVVFFLYDGSDIHSSLIATAITRAKYSVFIVSLRQSLNVNPWFRMLSADAEKRKYLQLIHPNMQSDEFGRIFCA